MHGFNRLSRFEGVRLFAFQKGTESITVNLTVDRVDMIDLVEGNTSYQEISIPGLGRTAEVGLPELPFKAGLFEIPYGVTPTAKIVKVKWKSLGKGHRVFPKQKPRTASSGDKPKFSIDREYYKNGSAEKKLFQVSDSGYIRGRRMIWVELYPVRFDPKNGELLYAQELEVEIKLIGKIDPKGMIQKKRLKSESFDQAATALIDNFETAEKMSLTDDIIVHDVKSGGAAYQPDGADYLIITYDGYADQIAPLAEWTTLKGYETHIAKMSEVGTTNSDVMEYIQNAYNHWSPAPSFLLLVGDYDQVPVNTLLDPDSYVFISDFPYSLTDGSDNFPDINLGRISVGDTTECRVAVDKIIKYDRFPDAGPWYDNALIASYFEDENLNCITDRWFIETAVKVMEFMAGSTVGFDVETSFVSDFDTTGIPCSPAYYYTQGYPHRPDHPDTLPQYVVDMHLENSAGTSKISSVLNNGVGLLLHRDHGTYTSWHRPYFSTSHVSSLTNGDMTPVILSINCETGKFNEFNDCLAERFLNKENGGAVGVVAASDVSYSGYNDLLTHGIFTAFWPEYDVTHGETTYANSFRPVEAMNFGKYYLRTYEGLDIYALYTFRLFHWFGDPLMYLRTQTPFALTVTHGDTIGYGQTSLKVYVDHDGSRVALSQYGHALGAGVSYGGSVEVQLASVERAETVYLTVTSQNAIPYESSLSVVLPQDGRIYLDKDLYGLNYTAHLSLADLDLASGNTLQGDTVSIEVWSTSFPAPVSVVLQETPAGSGFFEGDIIFGSGLSVNDGDTITAHYVDADDGLGGVDVDKYAYADIDGGPPVFSGLESAIGWDSSIELDWIAGTDSHGPITYFIYRADDSGAYDFGSPLDSTTAQNYSDNSVSNCEDYFYVVRAQDSFGNLESNTVEHSSIPNLAGSCLAEQFGSGSLSAWGTPGRGNIYSMDKTMDLNEIEVYMRKHNTSSIYFYVYESDSFAGDYTLIHSNLAPVQGAYPNNSWISSGEILVQLIGRKYYYIGFSLSASEQYYYGASAPQSGTFGTMETGVPDYLATYPPGPSLNLNYASGTQAPFAQRLGICSSRSSDGFIELDKTVYRHDASRRYNSQ